MEPDSPVQPIKIAILAMGGEGGGVLADWVVSLGEANGYIAQMTSVPGVAQRTGATIYYVELFPAAAAQGRSPVLAMMPMPGDVDVVIASELMEAARAVQRGLVTPDRTTLIASTHRVYAIAEKVAMADGRVDAAELLAHAQAAAKVFVGRDFAALAAEQGSVISAVLFGALAASGALPFGREQYEATIRHGGVGVQASLRAFAAASAAAQQSAPSVKPLAVSPRPAVAAAAPRHAQTQGLVQAIEALAAGQGEAVRDVLLAGARRLVDYQDVAYAHTWLEHLQPYRGELLQELARHLALWMAYEDTIRVAELKARGSRFERVQREVRQADAQLLHIEEYMHPRLEEVADTLPAPLGRWLLASSWPRRLVQRLCAHGRVVRTSTLRGFVPLWLLSRLKPWRRCTLRFVVEEARIQAWLADIGRLAMQQQALALEVVRCQRLVKGYGDTHSRGWKSFTTLQALWQRPGALSAPALAELRQAALADEHGHALAKALRALQAAEGVVHA